MKRTNWFDREFPLIMDTGIFPSIMERLEGTPARLRGKMAKFGEDFPQTGGEKWGIHKEIGHLIDLEPLWLERALQIIDGLTNLKIADLTNQKTHDADHDSQKVADLIARFEAERGKLLIILGKLTDPDLEKSAIHPRLGTPMRLIDLANFVAEHDDHHLAQITYLFKTQNQRP